MSVALGPSVRAVEEPELAGIYPSRATVLEPLEIPHMPVASKQAVHARVEVVGIYAVGIVGVVDADNAARVRAVCRMEQREEMVHGNT